MNPAMPNCVLCSVSTRKLRLGTRLYSVLLQCPVISIRAGSIPFACDLLDSGWYKSNRTVVVVALQISLDLKTSEILSSWLEKNDQL